MLFLIGGGQGRIEISTFSFIWNLPIVLESFLRQLSTPLRQDLQQPVASVRQLPVRNTYVRLPAERFTTELRTKRNTISAYTRQKAKLKYINRIRLERESQKQSSDTHKTPYDRVKRCRERKKNTKTSERVNKGKCIRETLPRPGCSSRESAFGRGEKAVSWVVVRHSGHVWLHVPLSPGRAPAGYSVVGLPLGHDAAWLLGGGWGGGGECFLGPPKSRRLSHGITTTYCSKHRARPFVKKKKPSTSQRSGTWTPKRRTDVGHRKAGPVVLPHPTSREDHCMCVCPTAIWAAGKREISEKTHRPTASSGTIPNCQNLVARPGIEPGSDLASSKEEQHFKVSRQLGTYSSDLKSPI
ncbi:hypothetical protein PR048_000606 [Dryococelus australis]|uniref:Uncharacterized protein n=1 Tax=Dryococelus australis TaxID=614101 RepID=A0ABQ9IG11_9NEOP|nr:hypothetical protein PR048_000606 [Dryococelus australis]